MRLIKLQLPEEDCFSGKPPKDIYFIDELKLYIYKESNNLFFLKPRFFLQDIDHVMAKKIRNILNLKAYQSINYTHLYLASYTDLYTLQKLPNNNINPIFEEILKNHGLEI